LPNIAHAHLDVIAERLAQAWEELVRNHGAKLLAKQESELNALLQSRLNHLRDKDRLLSQMVASIVRGAESISFDGTHIEKRPDLSIYLTRRNANFPLTVECKIVDLPAGKSIDLYCTKGLKRFVDGEYAWATSQGVMLAYVRDRSSIDGCLTPHLDALAASPPDALRTECKPKREVGLRSLASISRHGRAFRYIGSVTNCEPGPIAIWHMWMDLLPGSTKAKKRTSALRVKRRPLCQTGRHRFKKLSRPA